MIGQQTMTARERELFAVMGEKKEKHTAGEWALLAWPSTFKCKRTDKEKPKSSQENSIRRAEESLSKLHALGRVKQEWKFFPEADKMRLVFWR